jgi:hypothetical protein
MRNFKFYLIFALIFSLSCSSEPDDGTLGKAYSLSQKGDIAGALLLYQNGYEE